MQDQMHGNARIIFVVGRDVLQEVVCNLCGLLLIASGWAPQPPLYSQGDVVYMYSELAVISPCLVRSYWTSGPMCHSSDLCSG